MTSPGCLLPFFLFFPPSFTCLSVFLSFPPPSFYSSIPPPLSSLFSMFLVSPVHVPEIFRNLSYIVYDAQGTMLSLTCLVTFPGLMCPYQPLSGHNKKCDMYRSQGILILICWNLLGISPTSKLCINRFFLSIKWKKIWLLRTYLWCFFCSKF